MNRAWNHWRKKKPPCHPAMKTKCRRGNRTHECSSFQSVSLCNGSVSQLFLPNIASHGMTSEYTVPQQLLVGPFFFCVQFMTWSWWQVQTVAPLLIKLYSSLCYVHAVTFVAVPPVCWSISSSHGFQGATTKHNACCWLPRNENIRINSITLCT